MSRIHNLLLLGRPGRAYTGGPPPFAPGDVAGLVEHKETLFSFTSDIDGVSLWPDQAGGPNATQATGSLKPDIVADNFGVGVDGIQGDGTDDFMDLGVTLSIAGSHSLFYVFTWQGVESVFQGLDSLNFTRIFADGTVTHKNVGSDVSLTLPGAIVSGVDSLLEIHRDGADALTCFVNEVDKTTGTPTLTGNWNRRFIWAQDPGNFESNIIFGARLAYSSVVTGQDRTDIRNYLKGRYNL